MKSAQRRERLTIKLALDREHQTKTTSLADLVCLNSANQVREVEGEGATEQLGESPLARAPACELNRHCCAIVTTANDATTMMQINNRPTTDQRITDCGGQSSRRRRRRRRPQMGNPLTQSVALVRQVAAAAPSTREPPAASRFLCRQQADTRRRGRPLSERAAAAGRLASTGATFKRRPTVPLGLLVALAALTCCLNSYTFINHTQASSSVSSAAAANHHETNEMGDLLPEESHSHSATIGDERRLAAASDRLDSPLSESGAAPSASLSLAAAVGSSDSAAESSSQSSIVASLSSAVAQAAAAAAVAAAKSSLSSSDARSLLAGGHAGSHAHSSANGAGTAASGRPNAQQQAARSPGLHLALKLADAIPEVPYHILHNMKKLDHAAPFYNVGGAKILGGKGKESSPGLLATALARLGGVEQLGQLFKSPIWKRIADGYGEFTSEFRSLFRAPAHTMKGPAGSTGKMLRDISVPALLMLLATTMPSDWRPMRTRRKSLAPAADLAAQAISAEPMLASASEQQQQLAAFGRQLTNFGHQPSPMAAGLAPEFAPNGFQSSLAQLYSQVEQQQQQQQQQVGQLARVASDTQQQQAPGQSEAVNSGSLDSGWMSAAGQPTGQSFAGNNFAPQQQRPVRRLGELAAELGLSQHQAEGRAAQVSNGGEFDKLYSSSLSAAAASLDGRLEFPLSQQENIKQVHERPANRLESLVAWQQQQSQPARLFSSLTSPAGQLLSRIMNANGNFVGQQQQQQQQLSWPSAAAPQSTLMRREELGDKHKYSLVDYNEQGDLEMPSGGGGGSGELPATVAGNSAPSSLLAVLGQAIAGALKSPALAQAAAGQSEARAAEARPSDSSSPSENSGSSSSGGGSSKSNSLRDMARKQFQIVLGKLTAIPEATFNNVAMAISPKANSPFWSPQGGSAAPTAAGQASGAAQSPQMAAVANLLANAGSSAMKLIGLRGKSFADETGSVATSTGGGLKSKSDLSSAKGGVAGANPKGKLAGMVNMLVGGLANRQPQQLVSSESIKAAAAPNETQASAAPAATGEASSTPAGAAAAVVV